MLERCDAVLAAAQVIEELIQLANDIRAARSRGEESGSADDVSDLGFSFRRAVTSARAQPVGWLRARTKRAARALARRDEQIHPAAR
jgi:hypothetical protein